MIDVIIILKQNKDGITNSMLLLRSEDRKCPRCNNTTHTKECDFGDFKVVDDLSALYVDPPFAKDEFEDTFIDFVKDRSGRKYYLDCLCYVLTNDILYKQLDTNEKEMVRIFNRSTSYWWTWRKSKQLLAQKQGVEGHKRPVAGGENYRVGESSRIFCPREEWGIWPIRNQHSF